MLKRKFDEIMMYTPIGIDQVNPADCQGFVFPLSILQDASKLEEMVRTAWCGWHERFLNRFIKILISDHGGECGMQPSKIKDII